MKFYIRKKNKLKKLHTGKKKKRITWFMELCFMGISVQRTQGNAQPASNSSETYSVEGYSRCAVSTFFLFLHIFHYSLDLFLHFYFLYFFFIYFY